MMRRMTSHWGKSISVAVFLLLSSAFEAIAKDHKNGDELVLSVASQIDYTQNDQDNEEQNAIELRRLRLGASGTIKDIEFKTVLDVDEDLKVEFRDAYLHLEPLDTVKIIIGNHRTPHSLDVQTSSSQLETLERAAFTRAFDFQRRLGLSATVKESNIAATVGIFAGDLNEPNVFSDSVISGRLAYGTPVGERGHMHLATSARFRRSGSGRLIEYDIGSFDRRDSLISISDLAINSDKFIGAELAYLVAPFWVAGELGMASGECERKSECDEGLDASGGYAEIGFTTGGRRQYKGHKLSNFHIDKPINNGGSGALSFALRYDSFRVNSDIREDVYDALIASAHWRPNDMLRISLSAFDEKVVCSCSALMGGSYGSRGQKDRYGFKLRLQFKGGHRFH